MSAKTVDEVIPPNIYECFMNTKHLGTFLKKRYGKNLRLKQGKKKERFL